MWEEDMDQHENGMDLSGMGNGNDIDIVNDNDIEMEDPNDLTGNNDGNFTRVRDCSNKFFRQKLIDHFEIVYSQGEVNWPKRNPVVEFKFT
jgi:hypothetical protein